MQDCNTTFLDIAAVEKMEQSIIKEQNDGMKYLFHVADEEFGPTNWYHSVVSQVVDYVENQNGLYTVGVAAFVKVELRCGAYHQEIGYGISEGVAKKGDAISFAREDAAVNGLQKALLAFGGKLKNQLSSSKLQEVKHQQKSTNNLLHSNHITVSRNLKESALKNESRKSDIYNSGSTINVLQSTCKSDSPNLKGSEIKNESRKSDISNGENALNSVGKNDAISPTSLQMQSLSEEERRAARKRRQQQKQEEFRQIYQQKRVSVTDEKIDWSKVEGFPGTEEEFLTTQEVENLVYTHQPGMKNGTSPKILKQSTSKLLMDSSRIASPACKRLALQPKTTNQE